MVFLLPNIIDYYIYLCYTRGTKYFLLYFDKLIK